MPNTASTTMDSADRPVDASPGYRTAWEWTCNVALGMLHVIFWMRFMMDFRATQRLSSLLVTLFETVIIYYALTRRTPKQHNVSVYDWTVAMLGTYIITLLQPAANVHDYSLGLAVQLIGILISLTGLLGLNSSFGIVPADRGIKTSGMYRLVRHPIYTGYFLSFGALLAQNLTTFNATIYALFVVLQILRTRAEERVLCRDPQYAAYTLRTPWRLVPFLY